MSRPRRAAVVVLGDLGRSPRMQYHALALAAERFEVDLVGYRGSELPRPLAENEHIRLHLMPPPRSLEAGRGALVFVDALRRSLGQSWRLFSVLFAARRPAWILVQSPPPVPTLAVAWLVARLRSTRWAIDWHNFGYTLLGLKLGRGHRLVRILAFYERFWGSFADAGLCVSRAMREELETNFGIRSVSVLYDRPAEHFRPPPTSRKALLRRLAPAIRGPGAVHADTAGLGTADLGGTDRPALIVSPTSWTPDEDFSLLLEAAKLYDQAADLKRHPRLLVVVTGRGPLRAQYEARFSALALRRVALTTAWLEPDDYAHLLGTADLGLSVHRSSSSFDLPMKIADMFGSGLPVCAVDYGPVVAEQIRSGENGVLYRSGAELGGHWLELLDGFPETGPTLARLRQGAWEAARKSWREGWREEALPMFEDLR